MKTKIFKSIMAPGGKTNKTIFFVLTIGEYVPTGLFRMISAFIVIPLLIYS